MESSATTGRRAAWETLKRTVHEFRDDNLTDWAAALTYYAVLAVFPALIVLVAILGLFGDPRATTQTLTEIVSQIGPGTAAETLRGPIEGITANRGAAGVLLVVGLLAALWSASGYIGAFIRASNSIYEIEEGRPFYLLRPLQIAVTVVLVLTAALVALALVLTGPVVEAVAGPLGLGEVAVTAWTYAKWPVLLLVVATMISILYYAAPNVKLPGFRLITPGSVLAIAVWLIASAAFALYVSNFGSYDKTYGTLGGVVTFLVWAWLANVAILLGAEWNAELERTRELRAGVPPERTIALEPRAEPKRPTG